MFISVVLFLFTYIVIANLNTSSALPTFAKMWDALVKVCTPQGYNQEVWLYKDFIATYTRLAIAMSCGCLIGVLLGLLMGCFEIIDAFLYPILGCLLSYLPSSAIIAVLAVFFSTNENLFLVLLILSISPPLACKLSIAIKNDVSIERIDKAYTLGASHIEVVWDIVLRQILPKIIDNVRLQVGSAFVAVIAAELLVGSVGFGYRLRIQSRQLNWDVVYVYLIILAISGFLIDLCLIKLRKFSCPWFEKLK